MDDPPAGVRRRRARYRLPRWGAVVLALALLVGACSSDDDQAAPERTTTTSAPSTTTSVDPAAGFSDAGAAIDWFVEALNGAEVGPEEYERRVDPTFRAEVPYEAGFVPLLEQLRSAGPYTVTEPAAPGPEGQAVIADAGGTPLRVTARVAPEGTVAGLLVQPAEAPTLDDPPASVAEAFDRLGQLGSARLLAAEITDEGCVPVEQRDAGTPAPVGSVFKLYVLVALAERIDAGEIGWDDELVIRDQLKSIPTGILQDRPDGSVVPVREAAELMISISDNTATDHLIDLVGRQQVEEVMTGLGVTEYRAAPLLMTREMAALKLGPPDRLAAYLAADPAGRRAMLDELADVADLDPTGWDAPVAVEEVEWSITPTELCRVGERLAELDGRDGLEPVGEILSVNPGLPPADVQPDSLWFKGGSEPGVIAAWWRATAGDRAIVVAGSVFDTEQPVDDLEALLLLAAARDLLVAG